MLSTNSSRRMLYSIARRQPSLYSRRFSVPYATLTFLGTRKYSKRPFPQEETQREHIPNRNPRLPPVSKSHLLAQSPSSLWRLWVHIKWPLTRNNRAFSLDDFSALVSWMVMGNLVWIIVGTTTFGLVVMYLVDTLDKLWKSIRGDDADGEPMSKSKIVRDESFLGQLAASVLSHGLGAKIHFEKGNVLPELKDGMLRFRNVTIDSISPTSLSFTSKISDLNISLSFKKWYEGKGLVDKLEVSGMHAKLVKDIHYSQDDSDSSTTHPTTTNSLAISFSRHNHPHDEYNNLLEYTHGDLVKASKSDNLSFLDSEYELGHVKVQDSCVEIFEKNSTTPLSISIFNCELPRLRGNRLLIDFFNADIVTGTANNSMFTIFKHQKFSDSGKTVTFKLDGIDMGILSSSNPYSKFNWLVSGKAGINVDIRIPDRTVMDKEPMSSKSSLSQFIDNLVLVANPRTEKDGDTSHDESLLKGALVAIYETFTKQSDERHGASSDLDYVIVNARVNFTDLKASLPSHLPMASSTSVPFVSLQNLRSLVAYINSLDPNDPVVIKTVVTEKLSELYNLDNISQTRLFDAIVSDIYEELLSMIKMDEKRIIKEKSSLWSHSVISQLLLLGLGVLA